MHGEPLKYRSLPSPLLRLYSAESAVEETTHMKIANFSRLVSELSGTKWIYLDIKDVWQSSTHYQFVLCI